MAFTAKTVSASSNGDPFDFVSNLTVLNLNGATYTVGTPSVTVQQLDNSGYVLRAYGTSVPTDADAGYATGCLFVKTNGSAGTTWYINEGTNTSADFNAVNAGGGSGATWESLYTADNVFNITSGNGFTIASAMANANNAVTITVDGSASGAALAITNSGSGSDILGTGSVWNISSTGIFTGIAAALTRAANSNIFSATNNTATTANQFLLTGSGVFTGTGANSFFNITQSGATAGTVATIIANGLTTGRALSVTSSGVIATTGDLVTLTATGLTTGTALNFGALEGLTTGAGIKIAHTTSIIADGGSLLRLSSTSIDTGGATNGTLLDLASTASTAGTLVKLADTALTTGTAVIVSSTGVMTTTGNLMTLTANSATTAAGIFRINANGLTSGIGAVITSSATAMTGAGRLLRVDHTGATGSTAILSEFASAANDETVIVKITSSAALALGTALQVSGASITTGNAITANDLNALTTGIGLHLASSATAITTTGRLLYVNHTGTTSTSATLSEFLSAATDETNILQIKASGAITGTALIVDVAATVTGIGINIKGTAATMTTGAYFTANDGAANVFAVKLGGHLSSAGTAVTGVAGAGAGTTPGVVVVTSTTDTRGQVGITTGTTTPAGTVLTVTFAKTYASTPYVLVTPANANTAAAMVSSKVVGAGASSTTFTIVTTTTGLTDSTAYLWNYVVLE